MTPGELVSWAWAIAASLMIVGIPTAFIIAAIQIARGKL